MPPTNIWLQDDLYARVKKAGLPISEICQKALRRELQRVERRHVSKPLDRRGEPTNGRGQ